LPLLCFRGLLGLQGLVFEHGLANVLLSDWDRTGLAEPYPSSDEGRK
jgi:hypothetical protein